MIALVFHSNVVTLAGVLSGVASHEALGRLAGAVNITTILLGLVLVTTMVLSATALASVLILGALHWKWVLLAAGSWLLLLSWIVVIGYRGRRTRR
jgi:hypothetical protein